MRYLKRISKLLKPIIKSNETLQEKFHRDAEIITKKQKTNVISGSLKINNITKENRKISYKEMCENYKVHKAAFKNGPYY